MRILRIHAPGTDEGLARALGEAVVAFNRGLDIRLRFLSVGIDEQVVAVEQAAHAAESVGEALRTGGIEMAVLFGDGEAALSAAAAVGRAQSVLVRVGSGVRVGAGADTSRAIDRIAAVRLALGPEAAAALADEGLDPPGENVGAADDPETAGRIVKALSRARRQARGGR